MSEHSKNAGIVGFLSWILSDPRNKTLKTMQNIRTNSFRPTALIAAPQQVCQVRRFNA